MKERLLQLIDKTDVIESLFHQGAGSAPILVIYDKQEFRIWLQQLKLVLQEIYDRTHDAFIWDTINDVSANFNGWRDKTMFDKIKGDLLAIKSNIDTYYLQERQTPQRKSQSIKRTNKEELKMEKRPKIFISHSSNDKEYVAQIVDLLDDMGLDEEHVFCSSMPGYDIPITCHNIIDYLWEMFQNYNLHVIFMHSKNYYKSAFSMNEMGAAWVLKNEFTSFLLPGFDFDDMKGVIDKHSVAIKLDRDEIELKDKLNELYEQIVREFGLRKKKDIIWERKRDAFIAKVRKDISSAELSLSENAQRILSNVVNSDDKTVRIFSVDGGKVIMVGGKDCSNIEENCKIESAIDELVKCGLMKDVSANEWTKYFEVTQDGMEYHF